ncbi:MAG: hypothetical protein JO127_13425 [Caulobacteraceae bacterium]|nr:hypothetical protein [Caulobacteraceae bacterium]
MNSEMKGPPSDQDGGPLGDVQLYGERPEDKAEKGRRQAFRAVADRAEQRRLFFLGAELASKGPARLRAAAMVERHQERVLRFHPMARRAA